MSEFLGIPLNRKYCTFRSQIAAFPLHGNSVLHSPPNRTNNDYKYTNISVKIYYSTSEVAFLRGFEI